MAPFYINITEERNILFRLMIDYKQVLSQLVRFFNKTSLRVVVNSELDVFTK